MALTPYYIDGSRQGGGEGKSLLDPPHKPAGHSPEDLDRPRGVSGVLDEAFAFYVRNFFLVLAVVVIPGAAYTYFGYITAPILFGFQIASIARSLPKLLAGVLALIPLFTLLNGMIAHAIAETRIGRRPSLVGALRFMRPSLWSLLAARLVSGLFLMAVAAIGVGVYYLLATVKAPRLGMILAFIISCLWLYLYVTWLFVEQAVLFEKCSPWSALKRSEYWANGRRWSLFGAMLLAHMVITFVGATPSPFSPLAGLGIVQTLAMPLYFIMATFLYLDTRLRRERFRSRDLRPILEGSA
jgi:hypothetical protein